MSFPDINDNIPLLLDMFRQKINTTPCPPTPEKPQIELLAKQSFLIKISQWNVFWWCESLKAVLHLQKMRERDCKPLPALQLFNRFTPMWPVSLNVTDSENLASVLWCQIQSHAKLSQSCPAPCEPMDCGPPGSFVHGDSPGRNTRVGC